MRVMEENRKEVSRSTAARWYARLRAADCTQSERAEFEKWLHSSPD
ncbi:MAG: FecR/PupR family sigma factor regulator, partial [Steroidobacter sp.]